MSKMMLHFEQPSKLKTKKIVFEDVYVAHDSATLEQLKELSSRRRAIEESINESSSITKAIAREMSGGLVSCHEQDLHRITQYLPLLENLCLHNEEITNRQMHQLDASLKIRWSSALSPSYLFRSTKFFQIDHLLFELGMILFLYGAILRERALEVLSTDLVQSATTFREAAGIYHHLALNVLPSLMAVWAPGAPPETHPSVSTVMSLICLAEAQAVATRKAEENGNSSSLLAKLHHGVTQFLDEASGVLETSLRKGRDIAPNLMEFIHCCKSLHALRGQRYHAESLKASDHMGAAIGVLQSELSKVKKNVWGDTKWKSVFEKEIHNASEVLQKFVRENNFVWHEKIPSEIELPLPQGSKIVDSIPYSPKRWERHLSFKIAR